MPLQSDFLGDVIEFITADFFELLATRLELFVDLEGLLGHHLMRFLRTANERKIRPGGKPFMAVRIQSDAENHRLAFFLFAVVGHGKNVNATRHFVNLAD